MGAASSLTRSSPNRVVVGRYVLGDAPCLLGHAVGVWVGAADVPEHRGNAPGGTEGPEVLARGHGGGQLVDAVVAEPGGGWSVCPGRRALLARPRGRRLGRCRRRTRTPRERPRRYRRTRSPRSRTWGRPAR